MKKSVTITIPEPCHEDWAKMTPTEKGKFCGVCSKEVFDFTKSTDEELIKTLEAGKNLCGRFKNSQLDREVKMERKSRTGLLPYAASLLLPIGLIGASEVYAQGGPSLNDNEFKSLRIGSNPVKSIVTITGSVTDTNNVPVVNAEVFVLETGKSVRTAPDGSYKLVCTSGSTIFSVKNDLKSDTFILGTRDAVIDLKLEEIPLTTKVVMTTVGRIVSEEVSASSVKPQDNKKIDAEEEETIEGEIEIEENETVEIIISGTVTDEQNIPLPGVNVIVKGTSIGIQTDFEGNYNLKVLPKSAIVYSYLGYETKEITTSTISNKFDVDLAANYEEWMGEVVVIRRGLFRRNPQKVANRQARVEKRKQKAALRKALKMKMKAERRASKGKP